MIAPLLLAIVTATIRPAAPAVGDPITIDFPRPAIVDASPDYEIVSQHGARVVVRTFQPRAFKVSGRMGEVAFSDLVVPVRSVLKPDDAMQPAPLVPPRALRLPRMPFIAIGIAVLLAIAAWTAVVLLARRSAQTLVIPELPPGERFRAAVIALRDAPRASMRWARLADALRDYLAATGSIGRELTTREVLQRNDSPMVAEILRQGDREKFSPWGAMPGDFAQVAEKALALAPEKTAEAA